MSDSQDQYETPRLEGTFPYVGQRIWVDYRLADIWRFIGAPYPPEIFEGENANSVLVHTLHAIRLVESLIPPDQRGISSEEVLKMLSVHDEMEIVTGDTAVLNPLATKSSDTPDIIALARSHIQAPERFKSFCDFELLRRYIYGETDELPDAPIEGYLANLFDFIEGNSTFFELISSYVHHDGLASDKTVSDETIAGLVKKGNVYAKNVMQRFSMLNQFLPNDAKHRRLKTYINHIVNDHSEYLRHITREIQIKNPSLRGLRLFTVLLIMAHAPADDPPPNWGFPRSRTLTGLRKKFIRIIQSGRVETPSFTMFNSKILDCLETTPDQETIAETIKFGLLNAHRQLINKPKTLWALMDPSKRHRFAYELLNSRHTTDKALSEIRPSDFN